jgi:thioredoxin-like negative regulator of GroEL
VEFVKVNVDENRDVALDLGIRGVPTVITFNGNELVDRHVGVQPDEKYEESISKL